MKRLILFVFIVLCSSIKAQNLVPNYSFESLIKCTTGGGQFNGYVSNWKGQTCFLSCLGLCTDECPADSAGGGSVPYNFFDGTYYSFQYAHSGISYCTILTFVSGGATDTTYPYGSNPTFSNQRNYIQTALIDSLNLGVRYYVTFYVNLTNGAWYTCNNIGAYLSNSAPSFNSNGTVLSYIPQVVNNPKKQELTDTLNWMKISGSFIAAGGEKYITIGNFKNDSLSNIRYLGQLSTVNAEATYYIDDVIVSPDSAYADSIESVNELKVESIECKVFPSPNNGKFSVEITNYKLGITNSIEIYNMLGENVYHSYFSATTTQIDLSGRPAGVYLYRIVTDKGEAVASGKLIIQ